MASEALEAKTALEAFEDKIDLRFDTSNLNYPGIYVHIAWNSHLDGLRGHSGLQMTSEVNLDLKFELSGLNNQCSSACLASKWLYFTKYGRKKERSQI